MKYQSKWTAAGAFALCSVASITAAAQTAPDPNVEQGAPSNLVASPDPHAQSGAWDPAAQPSSGPLPVSTVPSAEAMGTDVVVHTWPNRPMLITGAVVLGGTYGASAIVGAASKREADDKLFYPVVGPWMDLETRNCDVNACGNDTFNKALLIGDGALQGLGALSILLSLVIPESTKKPWYLIGSQDLSVVPQVGTATTGLTAFGSF